MRTQRFNDAPPPLEHETRRHDDPFAPGTQILGKYTIVRTLGRGGMGVVVAARHNRLDEMHAIKFLLPSAVPDRQTLGRFEREARAAARLRGEHAVRVHDVGYMDADQPYMVMEYFEGQNLKTILRRGPLPVEEAVEYLLQVCDALTEVHTAGIVHRDLKPANLLLTMRPTGTLCVKLLDFGIAKFMGADNPAEVEEVDLTCDAMIGSLRYMSPEHIASTKSVDWRTDLWALGVTAYEFLTAKTPFAGHTRMDIMSSILDKQRKPEALHVLRPDLPAAIEGVILRCLEKDRNNRFQSAADVARALRDATGLTRLTQSPIRTPLPSTTVPTAMSVTDEPERHHESRMTTQPFRQHANRIKVVLASGAAAALIATLFVFGAALADPDAPTPVQASDAPLPVASTTIPEAMPVVDAGPDVSETADAGSPNTAPQCRGVVRICRFVGQSDNSAATKNPRFGCHQNNR
jgi:serine/threonine protein kinase